MKKSFILFAIIISGVSCKNNKPEVGIKPAMDTSLVERKDFSRIKFSNTKDPVCGMKLKFGIADSLLYQGKIIAFCNKGCKDDFIKNPKGYPIN